MSGQQPISGRFARLKPWHVVVIGGTAVASIVLLPALSSLTAKKKADDTTAAMQAAAAPNAGEPWHAPAFPEARVEKAVAKPIVSNQPATQQALAPPAPATSLMPGVTHHSVPDLRMFGQATPPPPQQPASGAAPGQPTPVAAKSELGDLLKPTELGGYRASRIKKPWATIEGGRVIACNSVTRMTSQMAGFVKARITYDQQSVDGTVTLIDHNSTVTGEIAHGLVEGQDRLFVLWRSITGPAPDFVTVTINSPAADELGEAGLSGDVNTHTWKRIGGALMLSGADALLQGVGSGIGGLLSHGNGNGNGGNGTGLNFYQFTGQGQSLASSLLQHTVAIPDTLTRDQAQPCSIFLSGALDFSSVYDLKYRPRR